MKVVEGNVRVMVEAVKVNEEDVVDCAFAAPIKIKRQRRSRGAGWRLSSLRCRDLAGFRECDPGNVRNRRSIGNVR